MDAMTKKEWQEYYGCTDDEMQTLEYIIVTFDGKITKVKKSLDKPNLVSYNS